MSDNARWWVSLIRGPLVLLRAILSPLYTLLFGWLDKRLAKQNEERLAKDISLALRFLFMEGRGRIIPNEGVPFPPGFDYAFVTVARDNLLFRFTRGRGELSVNVAPTFLPTEWHSLSLVLEVLTGQSDPQRTNFTDFWAVSRALEPQMALLTESFSPNSFDDLKRRLERVYRHERNVTRQVEFEINSRLYGAKRN